MALISSRKYFDDEDFEIEMCSDFDKAPVEVLRRAHSPEYVTQPPHCWSVPFSSTDQMLLLRYIRFVNELAKKLDTLAKGASKPVPPMPFTPQVLFKLHVSD